MPPIFIPPLFQMNPPPNPFWDFINGIEDHPMFAQYRGPPPPPPPPHAAAAPSASPEAGEKGQSKGKQSEATIADPPEVDPSTVRPEGPAKDKDTNIPFRGRGRFDQAFNGEKSGGSSSSSSSSSESEGEGRRRHRRGSHDRGGRHSHHHGRHGPHGHGPWGRGGHRGPPPPPPFGAGPFMFGPHPFAPPQAGSSGPHGQGPFGWTRGRGGCPRGRFGHHGPNSRSPPHGGPFAGPGARPSSGPFELGTFLNNLGERLGVDLASAAEGFGLDIGRFTSPRSHDSDFEPRTDIFDTASHYIIHLSLPGAKKSDVGVEWDDEHSNLRIAGVVHRPGADEQMLSHLVVDGRKRETGVFEKNIRLGTQKEPASVDVGSITAKMVDGVLIVSVPKIEKKKFGKKEVRVDSSPSAASVDHLQGHDDIDMDDEPYLTAGVVEAEETSDHQGLYGAEATQPAQTTRPYPAKAASNSASDTKGKHAEAEQEAHREDRSETLGLEHANATVDTLPLYEREDSNGAAATTTTTTNAQHQPHDANEDEMSDWERAGSDDEGEGEYVKINVD
ncbi:hypothetical protein A1O3_04355 [Capronia epimyces CBS 606.96]|uniref:SHSP domain-containing protein n=1 Tax=Capronia epimyces CBS 606.96 TaxID=1182542 RepID=W9YCM4_9EURO|nr:uncharacterized protein A1O3_04355 [Capronia epimyces CBS 606.96]EXJ87395.1 hypothetical protein A1O3_04355 [Capronia epimyces CBS 606.96]